MDRKEFNCTTWLHKAASLPKEDFKGEVKKYLTGRKTESCPVSSKIGSCTRLRVRRAAINA